MNKLLQMVKSSDLLYHDILDFYLLYFFTFPNYYRMYKRDQKSYRSNVVEHRIAWNYKLNSILTEVRVFN